MKTVKLLVTLCIISLSSFPLLYGQTDSTKTINLKGRKAITFLVSSNFTVSSFEGSLFSFRKMIENDEAWRLGVSLSGYHTNIDNISSNNNSSNNYSSILTLKISGSRQLYINPDDVIRGYYGYGLRIGYQHSWDIRTRDDQITAGPIGYIGVEWFVTHRISFCGEYCAQIYYTYDYYRPAYMPYYSTSRTNTIGLTQDNVKLGVSVYF